MYYLKFIFSILCILVMGLLGEKKKPKGLKPMKCRSVFPPSYKCITPKIKTDREISQGVKSYTVGIRATDFNEFSQNLFNQLSA